MTEKEAVACLRWFIALIFAFRLLSSWLKTFRTTMIINKLGVRHMMQMQLKAICVRPFLESISKNDRIRKFCLVEITERGRNEKME